MASRKTWTEYRLTDAQLKRLSQIVNKRDRHLHGNALEALKQKGLVWEVPHWKYPRTCHYTENGRRALEQARREGW